MQQKICVLGAGAWGSALACVAVRAGHRTSLWARSAGCIEEINSRHTNTGYLGELALENAILPTNDLGEAIDGSQVVLLAIPTQSLGMLMAEITPHIEKQAVLVSCCKGIDRQTGLLPSELVAGAFPDMRIGVLSGPSFAHDVVSGLPTAVTIAANEADLSDGLCRALSSERFRCYASDDIKGVELGGALKNVLALAVGAARGMELGASAEAALIARGFGEIRRVAVKLGAQSETLFGLSGIGDLVLTCSSSQSRNFTYGVAMGQNQPLDDLPLAEGAHTAAIALELAQRERIDTPVIEAIVDVLEGRVNARQAVEQLLKRPLKREKT